MYSELTFKFYRDTGSTWANTHIVLLLYGLVSRQNYYYHNRRATTFKQLSYFLTLFSTINSHYLDTAMTDTDILESLKKKEDELELLLQEARGKAVQIKEKALDERQNILSSLAVELEAQREAFRKTQLADLETEVRRIKEDAHREAERLNAEAEGNIDRAVEAVLKVIIP